MKTFLDYLADYESYHQHPTNRVIHAMGIPIMVTAVGMLLSGLYVRMGDFRLSALMVLVAVLLIFYYRLNFTMGLIFTVLYPGLILVCEVLVARNSVTFTVVLGVVLFLFSLAIQLAGHKIEGKRPATLQNAILFFIAPLYHVAETLFHWGWNKPLQTALRQRLSQMK